MEGGAGTFRGSLGGPASCRQEPGKKGRTRSHHSSDTRKGRVRAPCRDARGWAGPCAKGPRGHGATGSTAWNPPAEVLPPRPPSRGACPPHCRPQPPALLRESRSLGMIRGPVLGTASGSEWHGVCLRLVPRTSPSPSPLSESLGAVGPALPAAARPRPPPLFPGRTLGSRSFRVLLSLSTQARPPTGCGTGWGAGCRPD